MTWEETVNQKINELELIASWAAMTGFGPCRDHIRQAASSLKDHIAFRAYFKGEIIGLERQHEDSVSST